MSSSYPVVFTYVFFVFFLMAAIVMWPREGSPMLVVLAPSSEEVSADEIFYQIIGGTEARLVDKLSSHRFVIAGNDAQLVRKLYENGAFLVLRADPNIGCQSVPVSNETVPFRKV